MLELEKLNIMELQEKALEYKKKIADLRFDCATGKVVNTAAPKSARRQLARILTRMNKLKHEL